MLNLYAHWEGQPMRTLTLNLRLAIVSIATICATALSASASTVDVGGTGGADCTFWCVDRYQQVYSASVFSGPVLIDSVSFFAAPLNGGPNWNGTSTWQMTISTSANPVGALDLTFANNVGGDVAFFDTKTFTGTQVAGDLITFDGAGSFAYDPGNGDLLIDIIRTAGIAQGVGLESGVALGLTDRAFAWYSTTTADDASPNGYANRTRFGIVPEPSTALLVALGLAGMGLRPRR
jgi:PEP-CTERM motif